MADEIYIKHNLGTFQQPYIFQQNRNRQSPTIAQKVAQQPAIARQPSTYTKQSPYSFRAPVSYQEPNIRNAQSPYIANGQSPYIANRQNPFIRSGQTPFTYNHRSPGTYRNPVSYQLPFTYNYRSPGTYRNPVSYQLPFTYNYRSPGTYRNPVIGTTPITASKRSPAEYSRQSPFLYPVENTIADNFQGNAISNNSSFAASVQIFFRVTRSGGTNSATFSNATNYTVGAYMALNGTGGTLSYYLGSLQSGGQTLVFEQQFGAGGITNIGTDCRSNVYNIEDAEADDYSVYVVDSFASPGTGNGLQSGNTIPVYTLGNVPASGAGATVPSGAGGLIAIWQVQGISSLISFGSGQLCFYFVHPTYTDFTKCFEVNLTAQNQFGGLPLEV